MKNQKTLRQGSKQRGASMILVLIVLAMAALCGLIGIKVYPIYFEHWQLQSVVKSFEEEPELSELGLSEIKRRFSTRMQTNNIRDIDFRETVSITEQDAVLSIVVEYESRVNVYKNMDAVIVFDETTEIDL